MKLLPAPANPQEHRLGFRIDNCLFFAGGLCAQHGLVFDPADVSSHRAGARKFRLTFYKYPLVSAIVMLCGKRDCRRSGAITWPWSGQLDRSEAGSEKPLCGSGNTEFAFGVQEADNKRALDLKCWAVILGSGSKLSALSRAVAFWDMRWVPWVGIVA